MDDDIDVGFSIFYMGINSAALVSRSPPWTR